MALALVATCLVLRCYFNNPSHTPVPNWVRHVVLGWMARLTRVPVKKILHGIDAKEPSQPKLPQTDENDNIDPETAVHKKIPNISRLQSSSHSHFKNSESSLSGDLHPHLNLLRVKAAANNRHSMPPIFDNLGGAFRDGIPNHFRMPSQLQSRTASRANSRNNLVDNESQPLFTNLHGKSADDVTDADPTKRTLLETQSSISKDVGDIVRYIREQERGDLMKEEWQLVAAIIDKFFLWLFFFILCLSTVVIFMQAPSYAWE